MQLIRDIDQELPTYRDIDLIPNIDKINMINV